MKKKYYCHIHLDKPVPHFCKECRIFEDLCKIEYDFLETLKDIDNGGELYQKIKDILNGNSRK